MFNSIFPIKDFNDTASLEFVGYVLEQPKYDVQECLQRGMTYAAPFKVTIRLVAWDDAEGAQTIRDVKEQEVYFGEIPIMTDNGTFIVNGTERVIVSQLHRSPGIFFDTTTSSTVTPRARSSSPARVIPYRGSWLDLEFDHKDMIYARIDRRRKIFATVLLRALGYNTEELLSYFYKPEIVKIEMDGKKPRYLKKVDPELLEGQRATHEVKDAAGERAGPQGPQVQQGEPAPHEAEARDHLGADRHRGPDPRRQRQARGRRSTSSTRRPAKSSSSATRRSRRAHLDTFRETSIDEFQLLYLDPVLTGTSVRDTLLADKIATQDEAIIEIYRRLRPGDPPTLETATQPLQQPVLQSRALRPVARRPAQAQPQAVSTTSACRGSRTARAPERGDLAAGAPTLRREDILGAVKYLVDLKNGADPTKRIDDIDHLGNRRVRVGRRAAREPVPHRSGAHGARDQGAHVAPGDRDADAARPDQLQARFGGDQGVLRVEPAVAVHGPDQPARRR